MTTLCCCIFWAGKGLRYNLEIWNHGRLPLFIEGFISDRQFQVSTDWPGIELGGLRSAVLTGLSCSLGFSRERFNILTPRQDRSLAVGFGCPSDFCLLMIPVHCKKHPHIAVSNCRSHCMIDVGQTAIQFKRLTLNIQSESRQVAQTLQWDCDAPCDWQILYSGYLTAVSRSV